MRKIWEAPDWVVGSIFYEIFPDRFANGDSSNDPPSVVSWGSKPTRDNFMGGDLQGIIDHFPYLDELGVNALYLTPIFKAGSNHKYDTYDYFRVDPAFGTKELLRKLVDEAHQRGMRIILDAVFNHCGEGFWAFEDVKQKGGSSAYVPWFFIESFPLSQDPPNYQTCGATRYMPKLNTNTLEVREHLFEAATYWIEECGIDGWRLDVPWKVPFDFWVEFREKVKAANPEAYIVGEFWRDPGPWLRGDTCDGAMNYPLRGYILDYIVHRTMDAEDFDFEIQRLLNAHGPSAQYHLNLLGSHDTARILTLCGGDIDKVVMALIFIFTFVGAPLIYYGDEIGLTGGDDPECRGAMIWNEARWEPHLRKVYRALIRARREHSVLQTGEFERVWAFNGVYAYRRFSQDEEILVILNARERYSQLKVPLYRERKERRVWRDLMTGRIMVEEEGHLQVEDLASNQGYLLLSD
jgi:cyclomaltodextrinase